MFDSLNDTPSDFQQKLIGALNSIGETNGIDPVDVFNLVLCGNQDQNVKKKLYNWWRGFFDILSRCDIPSESKKEYDEKVDALISEITKAGSSIDGNSVEVVSEDYESASKEDEDKMLNDMKFAVSKIGEIANRVQDIINFVNPYCKKFNEENEMKNIKNESNMSSLQNLAQDYAKGNIDKDTLEDELYEVFDGHDEKVKYGMEECESIKQSLMERVDAVNHLKGYSAYDVLIDWLVENEFFDDEDDAADWWSTSKLNIRRFKNESNDMKYGKMNESVTNGDIDSATKVAKRKFVLGIYDNKRALSSLRQACHDDDVAMDKFRNWHSDRDEFEDCVADAMDSGSGNVVIDYMMDNDLADSTDEATQFVSEYLDLPVKAKWKKNKYDEKSSNEWVSMDSLVNEDEDDDEFEPDYHVGEHVIWDDPDGDATDGWVISNIQQTGDGIVYVIKNPEDGSEAKVPENEICLDDNYKVDEQFNESFLNTIANGFRGALKLLGKGLLVFIAGLGGSFLFGFPGLLLALALAFGIVSGEINESGKMIVNEGIFGKVKDKIKAVLKLLKTCSKEELKELNDRAKKNPQSVADDIKDLSEGKKDIDDLVGGDSLNESDDSEKPCCAICSHLNDECECRCPSSKYYKKEIQDIRSTKCSEYELDEMRLDESESRYMSDDDIHGQYEDWWISWFEYSSNGDYEEISMQLEYPNADGEDFDSGAVLWFKRRLDEDDDVMPREMNDPWMPGDVKSCVDDFAQELMNKYRNGSDIQREMEFSNCEEFHKFRESVVSESNDNEKSDDELKNASPKKFKNDNGSTSELVTGCSKKKQVSEMTIQQEIDDAEQLCDMLWGQGRSNLRELLDSKISSPEGIMSMISEMMGEEPPTLTEINDLLAYDFESVLELLGADMDRYKHTLDIVKIGDEDDSVELESVKK